MPSPSVSKFWLPAILGLALVTRLAALAVYSDNLTEDRDAYLRIAGNLSEGRGFSATGDAPTAYRPPLYPLVLSVGGVFGSFDDVQFVKTWVGGTNVLFSMLTIFVMWRTLNRHVSPRAALAAGVLAAVDPLLVYQVALPMTETLCGLLVVGFVDSLMHEERTRFRQAMTGIWFGLCVLCRPTLWAFAGVWLAVVIVRRIGQRDWRTTFPRSIPAMIATCLLVVPWIIRNAVVFGSFIPMTTHGGYTLLLANNEVFYSEVVEQSWRETWKGDSLREWQSEVESDMAADLPQNPSETAQSRWMYARAFETIRQNPGTFAKSCLTRTLRFWNLVPLPSEGRTISWWIVFGMLDFGILVYLGMLLSLVNCRNSRLFVVSWCLIASFAGVHLFFWSNMRMRVPLEPVLIVLAVMSLVRFAESRLSAAPKAR